MISSYEVGSIFRIVDEATPALERIERLSAKVAESAEAAKKMLQDLGRTSLAGLSTRAKAAADSIARIGAVSEEVRAVVSTSLESVNAGLLMAAGNARELAAAMTEIGVASRVMRAAVSVPGVGGTRLGHAGGGGGGRGGIHTGLSIPGPGGVHTRYYPHPHGVGGSAALIGAGAIAYGVYEEAELEDQAFRLLFTAGVEPKGPMLNDANYKMVRDMIQRTAAQTGIQPREVGEAALGATRLMGGFKFEDRMKLIPTLLERSATEAKLKGVSLKEASESILELVHMSGTYDPDKIPGLINQLAFASMISPTSLQGITRATSYAMPMLHAGLNMDPGEIVLMAATMQSAGVLNTKSGTWMREAFMRLVPGTSLITRFAHNKALPALTRLGLYAHGKPTFLDEHGQIDVMKTAELIHAGLAKLPELDRPAALKQAFGTQGSAFWTLMQTPTMLARFPELRREAALFKAGPEFLSSLEKNSPVQQARLAWADTTNILMDIATVVLPPLTAGLAMFRDELKDLQKYVPTVGGDRGKKIAGGALIGGLIGGSIGLLFGGIGAGPGIAAGAFLGGMWGGRLTTDEFLHPKSPAASWPTLSGVPAAPVGWVGKMAARQAAQTNVNVTVKAETDHPQVLAQAIANIITDWISKSSQHNLGPGDGVLDSPYLNGP